MTLISFLGHTTCGWRRSWPLPRWRAVDRIATMVLP